MKKYWILRRFLNVNYKNEDEQRKEFILNFLLLGSIILSGVTFFSSIYDYYKEGYSPSIFVIFSILVLFSTLYFFSRRGHITLASHLLILTYFVPSSFTLYKWGSDIPEGLLAFALIMIMASILINTRYALAVSSFIAVILLILTYLQSEKIIVPDENWRTEAMDMSDAIILVFTFLVISIVTWLSNREIEKSLVRARKSEIALKQERDLLEIKVQQRTKQLRREHQERIAQMNRFVDFGKLSSGLFHDLLNHLTVFFLNYEQATKASKEELANAKKYYKKALKAKEGLENFIKTVRKQLQEQDAASVFSPVKEITNILEMLSYKSKMNGVEILFNEKEHPMTYGSAIKFNHVITNIISNAIDAYKNKEEKKPVIIQCKKKSGEIHISIQDFGLGISRENLLHIFEPFFSTKGARAGSGIGLATAKEIIENDFKGIVEVVSDVNFGTTFAIHFPIAKKEELK